MTTIYICTPCFNSVETIDRTIISVIFQSGNFDIHYHIQDGGSTDGTLILLKKWQRLINEKQVPCLCNKLFFSYTSEPDGGIYDALAKGFSTFNCIESDWMGWINSDDLLHSGVFALLAAIDSQGFNKINWINGNTSVANDNLRVAWGDRPLNRYIIRNGMCDGVHWDFVQQEGSFFRNKLWRSLDLSRDFLSFKYAGDWNLWRKFAEVDDIYQVPWSLGTFFRRDGQISQAHRGKYEDEINKTVSLAERESALRIMSGTDLNRLTLVTKYSDSKICVTESKLSMRHEFWLNELKNRSKTQNTKNFAESNADKEPKNQVSISSDFKIPSASNDGFLAHDAHWQFPAVTEKHAFIKARSSLPTVANVVYLAFPWATLIDQLENKPKDAQFLISKLNNLRGLIKANVRVVTVSQHILTLRYQDLFSNAGVTDVFWSHAVKEQPSFPDHLHIKIHPFPLYPVQFIESNDKGDDAKRDLLYSFVGAKSNGWYLTKSRENIVTYLAGDKRGLVISRNNWHYDKIVYDHQIKGIAPDQNLIDLNASQEFRETLIRSKFSLCPSGAGPNTIRLWESIGLGAIPVILADTYLPPGDPLLWEEAVVFCKETEEAIKALPARLEQMAKDADLLSRKRKAMKQLWMLYGPDNFIYDIHRLYLELAKPAPQGIASPTQASMDALLILSSAIDKNSSPESLKLFMLSCTSRAMRDPQGFTKLIESNRIASEALALSFKKGNPKDVEMARRVFKHRNIDGIRL